MGRIDSKTNLFLEEDIICENNDVEFSVELIGNYSDLFNVTLLENGVVHLDFISDNEEEGETEEEQLKGNIEIPKEITFIALELKVMDWENKIEASTVIILEVEPPFRPEFTSDLYIGRLTDKLDLKPLTIEVTEETFTIGTYFELVPRSSEFDDTKYFLCRAVSNRAMITVSEELTPEVVWNRDHLEFDVRATTLEGESRTTSVVIGVPSRQCRRFQT